MIEMVLVLLAAFVGLNVWLGTVLARRDRLIEDLKKNRDAALEGWEQSIYERGKLQAELAEKGRQLDQARADAAAAPCVSYRWPGWTTNPSPPPLTDVAPYIPLSDDWDEKRH